MNVTKELREYASTHQPYKSELYNAQCADEITAIADRIDAEHERECKEQYACGSEHGIGVSIDASMIQTHGYVELPKDADGVPWSVGDRDEDGNDVIALKLAPDGWYVIAVGEWPYRPESKRHYHAQTVEDVLWELLDEIENFHSLEEARDTIAEYATKLRLAEGEN